MKPSFTLKISLIILVLVCLTVFWNHQKIFGPPPLQIQWQIASQTPLIFGVIPYDTDQGLSKEFAPLEKFLQRHLGQDCKLLVAASYKVLGRMLDEGKIEVAHFSQAPFELCNGRERMEVLCRPVVGGKVYYRGVFVVSTNSPTRTLEDLRGKHFAFVDPYSGTGGIAALEYLKKRGLKAVSLFGKISYSGNHQASLNGLRSGLYDGVVVFEELLPPPLASGSEEFRSLGFTDWILTDPIVVRKDMPEQRKTALRDLFVRMKEREGGREAAEELRLLRQYDRFIPECEIASFPRPKSE